MGSKYRGGEILLNVLRSQGTRFIFGNPGTTELPLIDALVTNRDITYVWGLQEATAVSMADGYAQASGRPAFVNLHTSGGLGHGMGAIINAKIARVPMVVTAGQQDLRHFGGPFVSRGSCRFSRPCRQVVLPAECAG
jgi:benzoylformate decarboxylase